MVKKKEESEEESDGGMLRPIYEGLYEDEHPSEPEGKRVSTYSVASRRQCKAAPVSLAVLAVVLLMVDIGLGIHYKNLKDTHLTTDDIEKIGQEMTKLDDTYKTAVKSAKSYRKQLDKEKSLQTQSNWELEFLTKTRATYEANIAGFTAAIPSLSHHLAQISLSCTNCPPRWILLNSMCYFYPFSEIDGYKTWQQARQYCQMHSGDLAVINSKDKENATLSYLLTSNKVKPGLAFWIGLRFSNEQRAWQWIDGTTLVEGYWMDGEPNNTDQEICVAMYSRLNFFKAWNDVRCEAGNEKWICEKAPTPG